MMDIATKLREEAKDFKAQLDEILDDPLIENQKPMISAIVAAVLSGVCSQLANVVDSVTIVNDKVTERSTLRGKLRDIIVKNQKLREAANNGDWSKFDELYYGDAVSGDFAETSEGTK